VPTQDKTTTVYLIKRKLYLSGVRRRSDTGVRLRQVDSALTGLFRPWIVHFFFCPAWPFFATMKNSRADHWFIERIHMTYDKKLSYRFENT